MIRAFSLGACVLVWATTVPLTWAWQGTEVPEIEKFVLATDRQAVLDAMVPGTDEHYWLTCLHHQHQGDLAAVDAIMPHWEKLHGQSQRWQQITARQALLKFDAQPKLTQQYLTQSLGLRFDHHRRLPPAEVQLPQALDPTAISLATVLDREIRERPNLSGLSPLALERLGDRITALNPQQRRQLLLRIQHPDFPDLVDLVAQELKQRDSGGFGSLPIHFLLTTPQLETLLQRVSTLNANDTFVRLMVSRLSSDAGPLTEAATRRLQDLEQINDFLRPLPATLNSLKAAALHERLRLEADMGKYDLRLFLEYLQLPRRQAYFHPVRRDRVEDRSTFVDFSVDYQQTLGRPPLGDDTALVERFLQHFLANEEVLRDFQELIEESFLQRQLAIAQVLAGNSDAQRWTRILGPQAYRDLIQRVDLEFARADKVWYQPEEAVQVALHAKNIDQLVVRIYELNTLNCYRDNLETISASLSLEGLVPNIEKRFERKQSPGVRTLETLDLPELKGRGVFLVDIIGGGKNARTLVRKGRLLCTTQLFAAGHALQVLDETCQPLKDASVWVKGQRFEANENGLIAVPFLTDAESPRIILQHGDFADLADVALQTEEWKLHADMHVARETLLAGQETEILVRPQLTVSGMPVPIANRLQDIVLTLTSMDLDGQRSERDYRNLELNEQNETTVKFLVPPRLRSLSIELRGEVRVQSQSRDQWLSASTAVSLNKIDTTSQILGLHLLQSQGEYRVEVVGKNGELRAQVPVSVAVTTRWAAAPITVNLQTNEIGQVSLGTLPDVQSLTVSAAGAESRTWNLEDLRTSNLPKHFTVAADTEFRLPRPLQASAEFPLQASLYRLRREAWHEQVAAELQIAAGWIHLPALAEGDYALKLSNGQVLHITAIAGKVVGSSLINPYREATVSDAARPTVIDVTTEENEVVIRLDGVSPTTRVHLFASRYVPAFSPARTMTGVRPPPRVLRQLRWDGNRYVSARTLGDEYLYILGRQGRERLAGNLLDRPSLLLAPWALGETSSAQEELARDEAMQETPAQSADARSRAMDQDRSSESGLDDQANLDYLAYPARVLVGTQPNADGAIRWPLDGLGDKQHLTIVVVDLFSTLVTQHSVEAQQLQSTDLRLPESLPLDKPLALDKRVETLDPNQAFEITDLLTSRFETVASLTDAWTMMIAATKDSELATFAFLIRWADLDLETKHKLYQQHACHEVNFFFYRRDRAYFDQVISPLISQRRTKTFFDQYLLEQDLTEWTRPWQFAQLNVFEKLLLAQRMPDQRAGILRQLNDSFAMLPPDEADLDRLFEMALAGRGLEGETLELDDELGRRTEREEAEQVNERIRGGRRMDAGRSGMGGGGMGGMGGGGGRTDPRLQSRSPIVGRLGTEAKPGVPQAEAESKLAELQKEFRTADDKAIVDAANRLLGIEDLELSMNLGDIQRKFYQAIQPTQRWVEYNYWKIQQSTDTSQRITLNRFWQAYAQRDPEQPFIDWRFLLCSNNASESLLALAVLDLEATSPEPTIEVDNRKLTWTSPQAVLMFHQQLQNLPHEPGDMPVMVSENFFDDSDRAQLIDNRQVDKFVADKFYTRRLYGARVVVTNPTNAPRSVKVLTQIPVGSIAVSGTRETHTVTIELPAFGSVSRGYWFYFPEAGEFDHFPAQVSDRNAILASAPATKLTVVDEVVVADRQSWEYVSQNGTLDELLAWLETANVNQVNLDDLAWRMKDLDQFQAILDHLGRRFVYNSVLWSYSVQHQHPERLREFLERHETIPSLCGQIFQSSLLNNDPDRRRWYEHIEFWPLTNARAHQVGLTQRILNPSLAGQYVDLLNTLVYRDQLTSEDRLAIVYNLLTQERIAEALRWFADVERDEIAEKMQYDYAAAWVALVKMDAASARAIADRYLEQPLPRWQQRFAAIRQVVDEATGAGAMISDPDSALQQQTAAAAAEASVDVEATPEGISLRYRNTTVLKLHYHLMDIELLFSRDPFGNQARGGLTMVKPNLVEALEIPKGETQRLHRLPEQLQRSNVIVEVSVGQQIATTTVYANNLDVQVVASMGQLQVRSRDDQQVLPATYVKVYGLRADGQAVFVKDGYTDIRGRFDYVTQSSTPLAGLQKLAILVSHEQHGSLIRQADLP